MSGKTKRSEGTLRFFGIIGFGLCFLVGTAFAETAVETSIAAPAETTVGQGLQQTQPTIDYPSAMMERASSGLTNVAYGPLEVIYQLKEEIKRTDPLRGLIPGLGRGTGWMVTREAVGIFELLTFYLPYKPVLKKFDTDWIYL